jgi:hypothetical protein
MEFGKPPRDSRPHETFVGVTKNDWFQTVRGNSDANLTANSYTEVPTGAVFSELRKLPWFDAGVHGGAGRGSARSAAAGQYCARNCGRMSGAVGQTASDPGKAADKPELPKYLNSDMKRRVLAALDTIRQNLEMVDPTGLEPVTPCG